MGADAVVAFFGALRRHHQIRVERRIEVNGRPGALLWFGRQYQLLTADLRPDRVTDVHSVLSSDKLRYLHGQLVRTMTG